MKAIETRYKGYRFRSRLEARWAVFFDSLGLDWEYEPEGFEVGVREKYLPDFLLKDTGHMPDVYVEVKPDKSITGKDAEKINLFGTEIMSQEKPLGFVVVRGDPMTDDLFIFGRFGGEPKLGIGGVRWFFSFYVNDESEILKASKVSRSARFEHGETPNIERPKMEDNHCASANIGDWVRHKKFGIGEVQGYEGYGVCRRVRVIFGDFGDKWLLERFAKLEVIK